MTKFNKIYRPIIYASLTGSAISRSVQSINQGFSSAGRDVLALSLNSEQLANVLTHGCWCQKLDPSSDHDFLGGHTTSDDLDSICKQWFTARRCNENHEGGSCTSYAGSGLYQRNGDKCSKNDNDSCEQDTCKIDLEFASRIQNFLDTAGEWNSITPESCPLDHNGASGVVKYCVGDAPNVYLSSERAEASTTAPPPPPPSAEDIEATCANKQFDVTILVDGSGSIDAQGWEQTVDFVSDITSVFDLGPDKTKVTLAQFSYDMKYYTRFAAWPNWLAKNVGFLRDEQMGSSTMTNVALNGILTNMRVHGRPGVPQIVILMTDGESSRGLTYPWEGHADAYDTAAMLHELDVTTFVVAIGDEVNQQENQRIASSPSSDFLIPVSDFNALEQVNMQIMKLACGMSRNGQTLPPPVFVAEGKDPSDEPEIEYSDALGFEHIDGED